MSRFVIALSCVLLASFVNTHSLHKKDDKSGTENASKKVVWCDLFLSAQLICVVYCIVYIFFFRT